MYILVHVPACLRPWWQMPVSLHTHSWYSLLEGSSSLEALLDRAAACGYTTLALTDTNNLYGAVAFVEAAYRRGIRPLLGACLRQHRTRCVALVGERGGYRNLCRILSRLHLPSDQPRDLPALLVDNGDGLHVLADDPVLVERLHPVFGPRLWLEVVRPARSPRQEQELLAAGRRYGVQPVASTAAHFATPAAYPAFRLATVVRRAGLLEQLPRRLPITPEHHLVDQPALWRRFRDLPEAVRNSDLLAEQLRSDVLPRDVILPTPRIPRGLEEVRYLRLLCERGLRRRDLGDSLGARQRLREELAIIEASGLAGYFLVVRDITRHARRRHSMALRGSAGNSLVCYLLEITDVDPLRFGLTLERFLHAGRPNLPDIDLDFDWKVRDEVLAHVVRRWGPRHTAQISMHQFLQPRSAFREAAKAHGLSDEQVSGLLTRLSETVEGLLSPPSPLGGEGAGVWDRGAGFQPAAVASSQAGWKPAPQQGEPPHPRPFSPEGREEEKDAPPGFPLEPQRWPRILADARLLLGRPHHLSIHPGGIVITPRPTEEYAPLQMAPKGVIITQFEKDAAEHIGLVKIDLLGNRALGAVDEALGHVQQSLSREAPRPAQYSVLSTQYSVPDPDVLRLLQTGDTLGITQLESPAMRHLLIQLRPRGLDDVIQALALLRPGVASVGMKARFLRRRHGDEVVAPVHPLVDPLLADTQGLMLYEDDALHVLRALSGLPVPDAARFYKRVAKSGPDDEQRLAEEFFRLCAPSGLDRTALAEQWLQLSKFRHYTFCKSHAVSYGLIAWQEAYLKAHHPLCFWTAVLNNNQGAYPLRVYVEAIKRAGIPLRLPCVNHSKETFTPEEDAIHVGLGAIPSLDRELRSALLAERERNGPYRDLADLRRRLRPGPEALGLLIRSGALDFTGRPRPALFLEADLQDRGDTLDGELFPGTETQGWTPSDYPEEQRLRDEWRLFGFLLGPPLMSFFRPRLPAGLVGSRNLAAHAGRWVRVAGLVATARQVRTRDDRDMQFVTLEDEWGLIEVTLFPGACSAAPYLMLGPYIAAGVVEEQYGVHTVTARSFERHHGTS
jgi:DNA polymerase III alpha subunit